MTNDYTDKARALVLTALMVFSVFAGSVAFAGSAAAAASDVTLDETTVSPGASVSGTVSSDNATNETIEVFIDADGNGEFDDGEPSTSVSANSSAAASFSGLSTDDLSTGEYTVYAGNSSSATQQQATLNVESDVQSTSSDIVFSGQEVVYNTADDDGDDDYVLRSGSPDDDNDPERTLSVDDDGVIRIDTGGLETGSYYITNNGSDDSVLEFEVIEQELSTEFDDSEVGNLGSEANTTLNVESDNRGGEDFELVVTSEDLDDDELVEIFGGEDIDADEEDGILVSNIDDGTTHDVSFEDVDAGTYDFEFDVNDSSASDEASINVTDTSEGGTSFADDASLEVAEGGVAEIPIELSGAADSGTLVIGEEDTDGYTADITFTDGNDDGEVTVLFNTYNAGSGEGTVVEAENDDDEASLDSGETTGLEEMLAQGDYTIAVSTSTDAEDTLNSPDEINTLYIDERSTDGVTTWTAPSNTDFDEDEDGTVNETDVNTLVEDGVVTEDDTVTEGDMVIHQLSASGLDGLAGDTDDLEAFLSSGVNLTIEQANPVQNQNPKEINVSSIDAEFIKGDGTYYIAYDLDSASLEGDDSLEDGDEYQAEFTVTDDRLLRSDDPDDHESVNATFEVEEESTSFDSDPVQVTNAENQSVSGTTNLAPGTELTVRASSDDGVEPRFRNTQTVTVQSDGSFEAEFDFAEQSTGDTFTASVRDGSTSLTDVDGEVVESIDDGTPTGDGTPTDTATPTDDGTPTDTATPEDNGGNGDDTPTETTTPGFTAVLALIALIGAALVAVRRD